MVVYCNIFFGNLRDFTEMNRRTWKGLGITEQAQKWLEIVLMVRYGEKRAVIYAVLLGNSNSLCVQFAANSIFAMTIT